MMTVGNANPFKSLISHGAKEWCFINLSMLIDSSHSQLVTGSEAKMYKSMSMLEEKNPYLYVVGLLGWYVAQRIDL